jgi:hypothetical protein
MIVFACPCAAKRNRIGIAANHSSLKSVAKSIWRGSDESPFEAMVIACRRGAPACIHNVVVVMQQKAPNQPHDEYHPGPSRRELQLPDNSTFESMRGAVKKEQVVDFLEALMRHLRRPLLVVWDRLPAHRSRLVQDYIAGLQGWGGVRACTPHWCLYMRLSQAGRG